MANYVKRTEGKRTFYLIPLREVDGTTTFLDCSYLVRGAIKRDKSEGHSPEKGPEFAHEIMRAVDYAEYVAEHMTERNLYKFNTKNYSMFINPLEQRKAS